MAKSDDDLLYSDIPDLNTQEANIYSDADGDDYDDVKDETDELYEDLDNPLPPPHNLIPEPAPPPLMPFPRKDPISTSASATFEQKKSKCAVQFSPASLGLNTTRIKNMKDGLKKIGMFKEKSPDSVAGEKQLPPQLKKSTNPIKKKPPLTSPKNFVKNDDGNSIYEDTDNIGNVEEIYETPDDNMQNEHQSNCKPSRQVISPPIPNPRVQPPHLNVNNHNNCVAKEVQKLKIEDFEWYWDDVDRVASEAKLKSNINKDGFFLVRKCRKDNAEYAVSLTHNAKIYHLIVRRRTDGKFAVGNEKYQEMTFAEVWEMVHYYKNNSLELLPDDLKNTKHGWVKLTNPINRLK